MNYQGYTIYIVDTETTGLEEEHDIIEISMCRFSFDKPDQKEQRTWHLKPLNALNIQDEALRINGHKKEDILHMTKFGKETYREPQEVLSEIESWIMEDDVSAIDRVIGGQNVFFDIKMMKALWKKLCTEDTFPFSVDKDNRIIDTKQFAMIIDFCTGRRRRFYNLSSLVKSFKIKKRKAHRAEDDVAMTVDLLIKMTEPLMPVLSETFKDCYEDTDE